MTVKVLALATSYVLSIISITSCQLPISFVTHLQPHGPYIILRVGTFGHAWNFGRPCVGRLDVHIRRIVLENALQLSKYSTRMKPGGRIIYSPLSRVQSHVLNHLLVSLHGCIRIHCLHVFAMVSTEYRHEPLLRVVDATIFSRRFRIFYIN